MSDRDTTQWDGRPCCSCGEDAVTVTQVLEGARLVHRAFCGDCFADVVAACPQCLIKFWQSDGTRIGDELFCDPCGAKHPAVVGATMAAILSDEQQDTFNRSRR